MLCKSYPKMNVVYAFFYQQQISLAKNFIRANTGINTPSIKFRDICFIDFKKVTRAIFIFHLVQAETPIKIEKYIKILCSHRLNIWFFFLFTNTPNTVDDLPSVVHHIIIN
jgi:hypothetical protein